MIELTPISRLISLYYCFFLELKFVICEGTLIRVHIGLEDVEDLIHDLEEGLHRYQDALNA